VTAATSEPRIARRSYSQLSTYRDCPRLFWHKYVQREPEQPSVWSVGGTAFHQVAEWYLSGDLGPEPEWERTADAWAAAWQIAEEETRRRNPLAAELPIEQWRAADRGKEDHVWWDREGLRMVRRFIDWRRTDGAALQVLHLEQRFEVTIGTVPVVVIPDWVAVDENGLVDIVDYKSGKPPKSSLQLGVYAAGLREGPGYQPAWGLYYMTRASQLLPAALDRWPHSKIADLFAEFHERELAGDYEPTPGEACRFCPFKKTCPAQKEST
jgi:RecB family exonuclease